MHRGGPELRAAARMRVLRVILLLMRVLALLLAPALALQPPATSDPFAEPTEETPSEADQPSTDTAAVPSESEATSTPAPQESPSTEAKPAPLCHREDFADFDQYVECQLQAEANAAPPGEQPRIYQRQIEQAREDAARQEVMEAAYAGGRKSPEELEAEENRFKALGLGFLIPGAILAAAGGGLLIGSMSTGTPVDDGGPECMMGKRCGDTCIEVTDTCHMGDPRQRTNVDVALLGAGVALLAIGAGLLIGGSFTLKRWAEARAAKFRITGTGAGIEVRF